MCQWLIHTLKPLEKIFNIEIFSILGLYFTEHSFIGNIYTLDKGYEFHCDNISISSTCIRRLLICRVALGKVYEAKYKYLEEEEVSSIPAGYHSVKFGEPKYAKYFVDNDAQVIWKVINASDLMNKFNLFQVDPSYLIVFRTFYDGFIPKFLVAFNVFMALIIADIVLRITYSSSLSSMIFTKFTLDILLAPFLLIWQVLTVIWNEIPGLMTWLFWYTLLDVGPLLLLSVFITTLIWCLKSKWLKKT